MPMALQCIHGAGYNVETIGMWREMGLERWEVLLDTMAVG